MRICDSCKQSYIIWKTSPYKNTIFACVTKPTKVWKAGEIIEASGNEDCVTNSALVHAWLKIDGYFETLVQLADVILRDDKKVHQEIKELQDYHQKVENDSVLKKEIEDQMNVDLEEARKRIKQ